MAALVLIGGTGAALISGCTIGVPVTLHRVPSPTPAPTPGLAAPAKSLVPMPRLDYARPASVAAAFFTTWASIDAIHDPDGASLAHCVPLITPALRRELASNQPDQAEWQAMHRARLVSLVRVQAITHPSGAPPASRDRMFLRIYAERVTTTPAGRTVLSDGITVQLDRIHGRWLVDRILFW